jgi:hypothetical protein
MCRPVASIVLHPVTIVKVLEMSVQKTIKMRRAEAVRPDGLRPQQTLTANSDSVSPGPTVEAPGSATRR